MVLPGKIKAASNPGGGYLTAQRIELCPEGR